MTRPPLIRFTTVLPNGCPGRQAFNSSPGHADVGRGQGTEAAPPDIEGANLVPGSGPRSTEHSVLGSISELGYFSSLVHGTEHRGLLSRDLES
jgi:hypothetical protein